MVNVCENEILIHLAIEQLTRIMITPTRIILTTIWISNNITFKLEFNLYKYIVLPIILYG